MERILELNLQRDPATALEHLDKIRSAVLILRQHPEIGRATGLGSRLRELVISHGNSGYIALYEYSPADELIRAVALRHQREAGYRND
ncbi:MAG: type II toxin-antitoxin system RelE/ParE family toxin [Betaproteobacteria bacterium]|nr:type II toxin-antitoxin system RelE/ParE family toxin [Betaproteobacteria bacterium]